MNSRAFFSLALRGNWQSLRKTDGYACKVAATKEGISALIEAGFEYMCQKADLLLFRKRK